MSIGIFVVPMATSMSMMSGTAAMRVRGPRQQVRLSRRRERRLGASSWVHVALGSRPNPPSYDEELADALLDLISDESDAR